MDIGAPGYAAPRAHRDAPMKGRAESTYRYTVIDTDRRRRAPRSRRTSSPAASSASPRTSDAMTTAGCSTASPCSTSRASGPAARASRWLADYGAARREGRPGAEPAGRADRAAVLLVQRAPRHAARAASTSRRPTGARRSSGWPTRADVVIESFRPGVVDRLGIGYDDVARRNPRDRLLLDHRLRPDRPALAVGRPRPQLPGRRRLPRLHRAAAPTAARRSRARPSPTAPAAACTR